MTYTHLTPPSCDLRIRAGRVVCPATGIDAPGEITVQGDRIAAVQLDSIGAGTPTTAGQQINLPHSMTPPDACRVLDFPDAVLLPGLIDFHAHPARSGSMFGVDPDLHMLVRGTTTVLSQGDAGADNCDEFVRETVERCRTRVVLAINLSARGEAGPGGCFERLEAADVSTCVAAVNRIRPHVWGIAVNTSQNCCGQTDPREVLRRGLLAADATGLPILYGMRRPEDWPLEDQLACIRPGDVVTYCFRRTPHCIVQDGRVLPAICKARDRGVLFDVGHGRSSFDFEVAEAALRCGFAPDSISTDLQRGHIGQAPIHDLPLVMSKLLAAGMPEKDVFAAVTSRPARMLGLEDEIDTLKVGSCADLTLLRWVESEDRLVDVSGHHRESGRWEAIATVRAGQVVMSGG